MLLQVCSLVLLMCPWVSPQAEDRMVQTEQGPVRGYKSTLGEFYSFFGIPYATAPTGRDKFKAPMPPSMRTEVFEATNDLIVCPQPLLSSASENCLVVNVFVPTSQQELLPVMFYIHGGRWTQGYGSMLSPELLLEHNVIVVHINYRLGPTGFLCLQNENIPGNAGYKDQVEGLRWVQRNIASFGGNPNDITIAGFSAGSIAVEYMMLSPMSKGLFHKAISESGSVLTPGSEVRDPEVYAKRFASVASGINIENIIEAENYLLNATTAELVEAIEKIPAATDFSVGLSMCVEREIEGIESFLTEAPFNILTSGNYYKVPYMTGMTSEDGTNTLLAFDYWKIQMEDNFADFLPVDLNFASENEKNEIAKAVKQFYFNNQPVSDATIRGFLDYSSDVIFIYSQMRSAKIHAQNSVPVYLYFYTYVVSEYPPHPHDDKIRGAIHCAQSFCVNRISRLHQPVNESENDILMRNRLTKMWSDFAKNGVPMTETSPLLPVMWERMDAKRMNYLSMDVDMVTRDHLLSERYQFWDNLYGQYYGNSSPVLSSCCIVMFCAFLAIRMTI